MIIWHHKKSHKEIQDLINLDISKEINELETEVNKELSIYFTGDWIELNWLKIMVDNVFAYNVALNNMQDIEDLEPLFVEECWHSCDWPKWQEAIQLELNSLAKCEILGTCFQTPNSVKSVGYKWVLKRKRNEKYKIVRYKACLVTQGFFQRLSVTFTDYYNNFWISHQFSSTWKAWNKPNGCGYSFIMKFILKS